MKKIKIQSGKFYVAVPQGNGEALFEFNTQVDQDSFIQELEARGDSPYALTPQQIKLEAHKQLSLQYAGGIAYLIVRKLEKEVAYDKHAPTLNQVQNTVKALLTELSPYLLNPHGSSEDVNLQIHLNKHLPIANTWKMKMTSKRDKSVNFTNYLHGICALAVDYSLLPPKKPKPLKN